VRVKVFQERDVVHLIIHLCSMWASNILAVMCFVMFEDIIGTKGAGLKIEPHVLGLETTEIFPFPKPCC
jgi:hypothetical protein